MSSEGQTVLVKPLAGDNASRPFVAKIIGRQYENGDFMIERVIRPASGPDTVEETAKFFCKQEQIIYLKVGFEKAVEDLRFRLSVALQSVDEDHRQAASILFGLVGI